MTDAIKHRGPDASGVWESSHRNCYLAHRRLAILDLSERGAQPMISPSGRFAITFNGEIYNYRDIRQDLLNLGHSFRGESDTEVLLHAIEEWGLDTTLPRLNGMFAFGLWDEKEQRIHLARDRLGKKPLYYGFADNGILFASELKAIIASNLMSIECDRESVASVLHYGYIPSPWSAIKGIYKLPTGTSLTYDAERWNGKQPPSFSPDEDVSPTSPIAYWKLVDAARIARSRPLVVEEEAVEELRYLLDDAVKIRMYSDVPLGAFLSGGIDSSMIVATMQRLHSGSARTFTIGFKEKDYDEASTARAVAHYLGTRHQELLLTEEEVLSVVPSLPRIYDEPFADNSQIPTIALSRFTRTGLTVALSGDGGDELFGGYSRYIWGDLLWRRIRWLPLRMRRFLGRMLQHSAPHIPESLLRWLLTWRPQHALLHTPKHKLIKVGAVLGSLTFEDFYENLIRHWGCQEGQWPLRVLPRQRSPRFSGFYSDDDLVRTMRVSDMMRYIPDDILVKVDRASMACSLEVRAPFLDYRLVEFSLRLPCSLTIGEGEGKRILRTLLYRDVSKELVERPKRGFGVPLNAWLRGPLREWSESLLEERALQDGGLFNAEVIRSIWEQHLSGRGEWGYHLWDVLMVQAWRREWKL